MPRAGRRTAAGRRAWREGLKRGEVSTLPTFRERQILANALLHGNAEGAKALGMSPQTLKNRLTVVYARLGVTRREEAAIALGWLDIPEQYASSVIRPVDGLHHHYSEALINYASSLLKEMEKRK